MMRFFLPKGQWPREQAALDDYALRGIGSFLTQKDLSALARTCKGLNLLFNSPPHELGDNALTIRYVLNKTKQLIEIERNALSFSWGNLTNWFFHYMLWIDNSSGFRELELEDECLSNELAKPSTAQYAKDLSSLFIGYLIYCMTTYDHASKKWLENPEPSPIYPAIDIDGWYERYIGNSPRPREITTKDMMLFMGRFVISNDNNAFMNRAILTAEDNRFKSHKHFFPHFAKKANEIETLIHATRKLHEAMYAATPSISRTPG